MTSGKYRQATCWMNRELVMIEVDDGEKLLCSEDGLRAFLKREDVCDLICYGWLA